jgi:hypothetical protein
MALAITIAVVVVLVAVRLTMPPWPNFLKMGSDRGWSKKTTIVLFAVAAVGAAIAIVASRL